MGRQFAINKADQSNILMLDIDTGDVLEIPASFLNFHNIELVVFAEEALAETAFKEWSQHQDIPLKHTDCVGFSVPLHLGGKDNLDNRERIDMSVHWELSAQILDQTKPLPQGNRITAVQSVLEEYYQSKKFLGALNGLKQGATEDDFDLQIRTGATTS